MALMPSACTANFDQINFVMPGPTLQPESRTTSASLPSNTSRVLKGFERGVATVLFNLQPKQIVIRSRKGISHRIFTAYDEESEKKTELGRLLFQRIHMKKNGAYGSQQFPRLIGPRAYYSPAGGYQGTKIFVDRIDSFNRTQYRGIGTALMQAVMEYGYSKGCEGRIDLDAVWAARQFYYKLGMRIKPEGMNTVTEQPVTKEKPNASDVDMYMPEDGIKAWRQKIQENPIFPNTMVPSPQT